MTLPRTLTIGSLTLKSAVILSPLERVSSVGFRELCFKQGAGITWTEMIRAGSVKKPNNSTLDLIDTHDSKTLTGIQFMSTSAPELLGALAQLEKLAQGDRPEFQNLRAVDINLGCPSPDIIKVGGGPALLKRRSRLKEMFEALNQWKQSTWLDIGAVGVKIRLGLNQREMNHKVYIPVVQAGNGLLDYMVVHARHGGQRSSQPPHWEAIGEVKSHAEMPIIGNGDVRTYQDWQRLHEISGCDGVMVGRGAIDNPWVFRHLTDPSPPDTPLPCWPSVEEVDAAARAVRDWEARVKCQSRCSNFHQQNFNRIRHTAETGEVLATQTPKNIHIQ